MVWSKWKRAALIAGLVCGGVTGGNWVYSQQNASSNLPAGVNPQEVLVINEPGKPTQHCVLVKTLRMPDGKNAVEVRNIATNETTTLIMMDAPGGGTTDPLPKAAEGAWSASAPSTQAVAHGDETGKAPAKHSPMPVGPQAMSAGMPVQSIQYRNVNISKDKPPVKCRVIAEWKTAEGSKAAQLQSVESGEIMTMVEIAPAAGSNGSVTASLYQWGHSTTPPPGVPVPPLGQPTHFSGQENVVMMPSAGYSNGPNPNQKPSLAEVVKNAFGGLFGGKSSPPAPAASPMPMYRTETVVSSDLPRTSDVAKTMKQPVKEGDALKAFDTARPMPKLPDTARVNEKSLPLESPKKLDAPSIDLPKANGAEKTTDVSTSLELPKPVVSAPKDLDLPAPPGASKPGDTPKTLELPKINEGPKFVGVPKPPETPKLPEAPKQIELPKVPAPTVPPPPPAGDYKSQWAPGDAKAPGFGKPSADTTLPPTPIPVAPPSALPGLPSPSAMPATPQMPPAPIQVPLGASKTSPGAAAPPAPVEPPALPPVPVGSAKRIDPLNSPENFMPKRAEDKMAVTALPSPPGTAQASDAPRPAGMASVASANASDPRYLPMSLPQAKTTLPNVASMQSPEYDAAGFSNAFSSAAPPQNQGQQPMPQANYPAPAYAGYPSPMVYNGPMPPAPVMAGQGYPMPMMQQGYPMPQMQPIMYANPAMDRPGMPISNMSPQQSINVLQSSIYPSQRELAIYQLSSCEWRSNPQVVQLLLTAAKDDPAAMVRAAAVNSLCRMGVATNAVQATFQQLKSDTDPRVRAEAEQALVRCSAGGQ